MFCFVTPGTPSLQLVHRGFWDRRPARGQSVAWSVAV